MINRRWHQAHEERHLQRCDDKQQPNDQEHQQRVGHLCNEATTHFQELHCPVSARGARIISSVMIPGRSCHSAQNCQYMSAVMRRSCHSAQNCQYMSTVMRRSCHSAQNCQYMSAIMIPGHRRADNQQITSSARGAPFAAATENERVRAVMIPGITSSE